MAKFAIIPEAFIRDKRISDQQRRVYLALALHADTDGNCHPSRAVLAEICGMSEGRISEATTALANLGYLEKHGDGGKGVATRYILARQLETVTESVTVTDLVTVTESVTGRVTESVTPCKEQTIRTDQSTHQRARETENKRPSAKNRGAEGPDNGDPEKRTRAKPAVEAKKRKVAISDNWTPSDRCKALIAQAGIPLEFAEAQIGEFVLYWQERGEKRSGWDATFLNRCKQQWAWQQKAPGGYQPNPRASQQARGNHEANQRPYQSAQERVRRSAIAKFGFDPDAESERESGGFSVDGECHRA